jgi:hypothetical protein
MYINIFKFNPSQELEEPRESITKYPAPKDRKREIAKTTK